MYPEAKQWPVYIQMYKSSICVMLMITDICTTIPPLQVICPCALGHLTWWVVVLQFGVTAYPLARHVQRSTRISTPRNVVMTPAAMAPAGGGL